MSKTKVITIVVVLAVIAAIPIIVLQRRNAVPKDKNTRLALMSMKSDLHGLIMAEETTKRLRGHYVTDAQSAGHMSSVGVTPPIITLADTGWSATVGYKTIPEIRCAVGVYARNPLKRFAKSGEIVCE